MPLSPLPHQDEPVAGALPAGTGATLEDLSHVTDTEQRA